MFAVNQLKTRTSCAGLNTNHVTACEAAVPVSEQTDGMAYFNGELCLSQSRLY